MAAVANPGLSRMAESGSSSRKDGADQVSSEKSTEKSDGRKNNDAPGSSNGDDSDQPAELNPFDAQFGTNHDSGPTKTAIPGFPPLASSPSGNSTPTWRQSGPLSPAINPSSSSGDYFSGHHFRGGIPTHKESSLRSGLTPGSASASGSFDFPPSGTKPVSVTVPPSGDSDRTGSPVSGGPRHSKSFSSHDANAAANGLFMLAQSNRPAVSASRQGVTSPTGSTPTNTTAGSSGIATSAATASSTTAPASASVAPYYSDPRPLDGGLDGDGRSEDTADSSFLGSVIDTPPVKTGRGRGKKSGPIDDVDDGLDGDQSHLHHHSHHHHQQHLSPASGRRQKRQKTVAEPSDVGMPEAPMSTPDHDQDRFAVVEHGKGRSGGRIGQPKMTDEEKRRNFLERNRVAALKCRQRKKQWLSELQAQCDQAEANNESMQQQLTMAKSEVAFLKNILFNHRDVLASHWSEPHSLSHILEGGMVPVSSVTGYLKERIEPTNGSGGTGYNVFGVPNGSRIMPPEPMRLQQATPPASYTTSFSPYNHAGSVGSATTGAGVSVSQAQAAQAQAAQAVQVAQAQAAQAQAQAQAAQAQIQTQSQSQSQPHLSPIESSPVAEHRGSISFSSLPRISGGPGSGSGSTAGSGSHSHPHPHSQSHSLSHSHSHSNSQSQPQSQHSHSHSQSQSQSQQQSGNTGVLPSLSALSSAIGAGSGSEMPRSGVSMMSSSSSGRPGESSGGSNGYNGSKTE